jgi:enoyl-CoA hydratase/carnithine racemase
MISLQDRVLTVTLDRADKRNALTHEMYTGLAEALVVGAGSRPCLCRRRAVIY